MPLTSGTGRKFGIVLRFINNDVIVGEEIASFTPDCSSQNDWQYLSMRVAAKAAYTSLRILLVYECTANVVYFDGVQLFNTYGPWGEACGMSGTLASTLGDLNPFRYRGYVYDAETELYYLNSRYYNPVWGRFINADVIMGANSDADTYNLFAYCGNNPVIRCDKGGMLWNSLALIIRILPFELHVWNTIAVWVGVDTAAIGGKVLNMTKKGDTYHADFDCWQQYFGYNDFYDLVFDWATSCVPAKFRFTYSGQEYVIWAWKGDYINMGAGAEMGIYTGGGPHWRVDKNLAMPMWVWLKYDGKTIVSHNDTTWWITGFNPNYLNKNENSLTAIFSIRFNDPGMYYAFSATKPAGWKFGLMQGVGVAYFIF